MPKKDPVEIPAQLNTPEFHEIWDEFQQHRREMRKPVTPTSARRILKRLSQHPVAYAIACIEQSLDRGWQGIFPLKTDIDSIGGYRNERPSLTFDDVNRIAESARASSIN
jgi:hypothetical protein